MKLTVAGNVGGELLAGTAHVTLLTGEQVQVLSGTHGEVLREQRGAPGEQEPLAHRQGEEHPEKLDLERRQDLIAAGGRVVVATAARSSVGGTALSRRRAGGQPRRIPTPPVRRGQHQLVPQVQLQGSVDVLLDVIGLTFAQDHFVRAGAFSSHGQAKAGHGNHALPWADTRNQRVVPRRTLSRR